MPHITSTATGGIDFTEYVNVTKDRNAPKRKVSIAGGSNVSNKHFITPRGVVTHVTDEELEFLKSNFLFNRMVKGGFLTITESKVDPEVVLPDMEIQDKSAPKTPNDYEPGKAPKTDKEQPFQAIEDKAKSSRG
jgi:hypothetical protein